jgi:multiple sugar transport system substrate-binding protein
MQPQATYAKLTANQVFDPRSPNAGVASPLFDIAGNAFTAALNNEIDAQTAAEEMKQGLDELK